MGAPTAHSGHGCWNQSDDQRRAGGRASSVARTSTPRTPRGRIATGGDRIKLTDVRVVLAEDSVLLREGLVRLLTEAGADVVDAVGDGEALVQSVIEHRPDVAVVDVRMPPSHTDEGLRAALEARRHVPGIGILVLSQYVEETYASDLLADSTGGVRSEEHTSELPSRGH